LLEVKQSLGLPAGATQTVEDQTTRQADERENHQTHRQNCRRKAGNQSGFDKRDDNWIRENQRDYRQHETDRGEKAKRLNLLVEDDHPPEDHRAMAISAKLAVRTCWPGAVG